MNHYIKHIVERFDFNSVKKDNRSQQLIKTAIDATIKYKLNDIVNDNILKFHKPTKEDLIWLYSQISVYKVEDKEELKALIDCCIAVLENECNLNWIDVSNVTDMSYMFYESKFNGDISQWNVSNVTNMKGMFYNSKFNGDISQWNVSNVTNMHDMFFNSKFNGDISQWDVSKVTDMNDMFWNSEFNVDISNWNVSNVTNMSGMFGYSKFNVDISKWDVNNVTDMEEMFTECPIKEEYKPKFKRKHNL